MVRGEKQFPKLSSDPHTSTTVTPPIPPHTHTQINTYDERKLKQKKRERQGMVAHDCHLSTQKLHVKFKTSLGFGEFQGSRALVRPDPKKRREKGRK